ncbi:MAG: phosphatase PAP2 family protein [Candidatus Paceibacterota bacterium]|jgi:membrane-associated phospholipid phosphatase
MLNNQIFFELYNFSHQSIFFDRIIIFIADIFPYIVVISAILFLFLHKDNINSNFPFKEFKRRIGEIVLVFFSSALAWFLAFILKLIIQSPRPTMVFQNVSALLTKTDFAFPSGHATFFMALGVSLFFCHKKIGDWFIFFALLIGIARIMAGVHFPIDILGGFILGILVACTIKYFQKKEYK